MTENGKIIGVASLGISKVVNGLNEYIHVKYAPTDNLSLNDMTDSPNQETKYLGVGVSEEKEKPKEKTFYSWTLIKGEEGVGSYTWFRYSEYENPKDETQMTLVPVENTLYIGVATTEKPVAPSKPELYTWARIKGEDGNLGYVTRLSSGGVSSVTSENSPVKITLEAFFNKEPVSPSTSNWFYGTADTGGWVSLEGEKNKTSILIDKDMLLGSSFVKIKNISTIKKAEIEEESVSFLDLSNQTFDATKPLILKQPNEPSNPYPGLLWMDTSGGSFNPFDKENPAIVYRWGKGAFDYDSDKKVNGESSLFYKHYAFSEDDITEKDVSTTFIYPKDNFILDSDSEDGNYRLEEEGTLIIKDRNQGFFEIREENLIGQPLIVSAFVERKKAQADGLAKIVVKYSTRSAEDNFFEVSNKDVDIPEKGRYISKKITFPEDLTKVTLIEFQVIGDGFKISSPKIETAYVNQRESTPYTNNRKKGELYNAKYVGVYIDQEYKPYGWAQNEVDIDAYKWTLMKPSSISEAFSDGATLREEDENNLYGLKELSLGKPMPNVYSWIQLQEEELLKYPWLLDEDGSTIIDWIYEINQQLSEDAIINTVVGSQDLSNIYSSIGDFYDLSDRSDEFRKELDENDLLLKDYANSLSDLGTKQTNMEQKMDSFDFKIQQTSGLNLVKNSTGFHFVDSPKEERGFPFWDIESGKENLYSEYGNEEMKKFGIDSYIVISPDSSEIYSKTTISQEVSLPVLTSSEKELSSERTYSFSFFAKHEGGENSSNSNNLARIKITEGINSEVVYETSVPLNKSFTKYASTFHLPESVTSVKITIEQETKERQGATFRIGGIMLNIGSLNLPWQPYRDEVYSTNVKMDGGGIKVFTLEDGEKTGYTLMSPKEFAGYNYNREDRTYEKIFTLNGDTTQVKKLNADQEFSMNDIKIKRYGSENSSSRGWMFEAIDVESRNLKPLSEQQEQENGGDRGWL